MYYVTHTHNYSTDQIVICQGWKAGVVGNQWCNHCQDFPPLWYSSHFFPLVCSVSVCMFKILVRTEILLLPLRSGLQTGESSPLRRSLLSAREQGLLLETDGETQWMYEANSVCIRHTHGGLPQSDWWDLIWASLLVLIPHLMKICC